MEIKPLSKQQIEKLHKLGLDEKKLIHPVCRVFEYQEELLRANEPIHDFMIVTKGIAKLQYFAQDGKNMIISCYISDGFLGDLELMSKHDWTTTTVTAGTLVEVIAIPFQENKDYLYNNLKFLQVVGKELSLKLLQSSNYYIASSLFPAKARLCFYILQESYRGVFKACMKDVCASTGMSYRHMYRILEDLCDEKILEKKESGYIILDEKRLREETISIMNRKIDGKIF